jgi:serine/threonine protein kinase
MLKIRNLKDWQLIDVLRDKYCLPTVDAAPLADLLGQMLTFNPARRATAARCMEHPWFNAVREHIAEQAAAAEAAAALGSTR